MFQAFVQNQTRFVVAPWAPQFSVIGVATPGIVKWRVSTFSVERTSPVVMSTPHVRSDELLAALEDVRLRAADRPRCGAPAGRVPLTLST